MTLVAGVLKVVGHDNDTSDQHTYPDMGAVHGVYLKYVGLATTFGMVKDLLILPPHHHIHNAHTSFHRTLRAHSTHTVVGFKMLGRH